MTVETLRQRASLAQSVRTFFIANGYIEVETPILSPDLIPEAHIEVFKTQFVDPFRGERDLFLIPSPELWMKRLLAQGSGNIFQLTKAFRNCESIGRLHNPEFTMLEWYTVGADYSASIEITEELFRHLLAGTTRKDLAPPFRLMTMEEAFRTYAGIDLSACASIGGLLEAALSKPDICASPADTWEELFNKVFLTYVEPNLPQDRPLVLCDYPANIDTLAKRIPGTDYLERWELYVRGMELANCFTEETNPERMRSFFASESKAKAEGIVPHPVDETFPDLFARGFPDISGVALGFDRLVMAFTGTESIRGVISFPFSDKV